MSVHAKAQADFQRWEGESEGVNASKPSIRKPLFICSMVCRKGVVN